MAGQLLSNHMAVETDWNVRFILIAKIFVSYNAQERWVSGGLMCIQQQPCHVIRAGISWWGTPSLLVRMTGSQIWQKKGQLTSVQTHELLTAKSTFQLECHCRKCSRKKKAPRKLKYRHKHPAKVHMWTGISKEGATTHIVLFSGIMNATKYGDILAAALVPFIREKYPNQHRLFQDNDPKHTSKYIQNFFATNNINWWKSPAETPDLNSLNYYGAPCRPFWGINTSQELCQSWK